MKHDVPLFHRVFRPPFREALWAAHTPNARQLTCPGCGHQGFCVEVYARVREDPS